MIKVDVTYICSRCGLVEYMNGSFSGTHHINNEHNILQTSMAIPYGKKSPEGRTRPWRSDMEADLCPDCWEAVYKYARTKP